MIDPALSIARYTQEQKGRWNDFVTTSRNGFFMFDRHYMDYHADRFEDHSLMVFDAQEKLVALLPANLRDGVLYSHQGLTFGGFITGNKMRTPLMMEAMQALCDYAREQGIQRVVYKAIPYFYHRQPAQEDLYALFRMGAQCVRVDVSSTLDYTTKRYPFSSSRRSGLKKARESGLEVRESDDISGFFAMLNAVLDEKYATHATHSAEEMQLLQARFPKNIRLYGCFDGEDMLAGIITYETDIVAHTQYIGSNARGKELGATDLILEHLINSQYTSKNYFDFGISTEEAGRYLNTSLISQKEGAGARATVHQIYELTLS